MLNIVRGESQAMKEAWEKAVKASRSEANVLLWGETGSGKNLLAEYIHRTSRRAQNLMLKLDCATIPAALLESELFGHEKGAFTGADHLKQGLLELAQGSTLFLNEVGSTPLELQTKLLAVLEERTFRRIGGTKEIGVDFRLISATNHDLREMIEARAFRRDLYYRLNTVEIHLPPLRERREDILPLVEFYLERYTKRYEKSLTLSEEAGHMLLQYSWPGNVRELMNVVESLVVLTPGGEILPQHLPLEVLTADIEAKRKQGHFPTLREVEREHILRVFYQTGGNKKKTARLLGISLNTLKAKLRGYGLRGVKI